MRRSILLFAAGAAALAIAGNGCGKRDGGTSSEPGAPATTAEPAPPSPRAPDRSSPAGEARSIFATRCAGCHGASGKGDGPTAASLSPGPRDYTDRTWQASVTDAELSRVIVEGGTAVGRSAMMPPAADLRDKPEVVAELVKMIRAFAN